MFLGVCSKEVSHREGTFEYPQHFGEEIRKNIFNDCIFSGGLQMLFIIDHNSREKSEQ